MGTHCTISMITPNGSKKTIYSQFDGYLEHTGNLLLNDWNTQKKVSELVKFGDIECIYEYPIVKSIEKIDVRKDKNPLKNRMGGEYDLEEFNYLWKDGKWYVTVYDGISEYDDSSKYKTVLLKNAIKNGLRGYKIATCKTSPKKKISKKPSNKFPKLNVEGMF